MIITILSLFSYIGFLCWLVVKIVEKLFNFLLNR